MISAFVNKDKCCLIEDSFLRLLMINNKPLEVATKAVKPIGFEKMVYLTGLLRGVLE
jgi:hypothetical protein